MSKLAVIDGNGLLIRNFFANFTRGGNVEAAPDLALHSALITMNKYFNKIKPDKIFMCFDNSSWRKTYTESEECVSKKVYKAQRKQNMSPKQKELFSTFIKYINELGEILDNHTKIVVLKDTLLEADDLIAGVTRKYCSDHEVTILSSDNDFIQLMKYPNVKILDPMKDAYRDLKEFNNDANYFMFEKCLRGDVPDNVQSAYPNIRKKKIQECYEDDFKRLNMLEETWVNQNNVTFKVKDLYEENQLLMDFDYQPDFIKDKIEQHINTQVDKHRKFDYFKFVFYLNKHELNNIKDSLDLFTKMLNVGVSI